MGKRTKKLGDKNRSKKRGSLTGDYQGGIQQNSSTVWGFMDNGLYCNTDLCRDHKFRRQLCTKEFKGKVNQEMRRVIKMGIKLHSFISKL